MKSLIRKHKALTELYHRSLKVVDRPQVPASVFHTLNLTVAERQKTTEELQKKFFCGQKALKRDFTYFANSALYRRLTGA